MADGTTGVAGEAALLADIERRFRAIAGEDGIIDREEFREALKLGDDYYADRLFSMVDDDDSGEIDLDEFMSFVRTIVEGGERDRLQFVFRLHDPDDSGEIERNELRQVIAASTAEHGIELPAEAVDGLTDALFNRADADGGGGISFEEFAELADAYPEFKKHLTFSATTWLKPKRPKVQRKKPRPVGQVRKLARTINNNRAASLFLLVYAVINVALFVNAMQTYAEQGASIFVQIARGCGACLNFNGALILVPMLRHFLTWLRQSLVGGLLPIDDSIAFHRLVGHVMMGFALVHTAMHLVNYSSLPESMGYYLFSTQAGLTGVLLTAVFVVMWVCTMDFVRRGGHFELFYFTHFGFVLWFGFALFHGPAFWQWVALPVAAYIVERIMRTWRTSRKMPVTAIEPLASSVTRLELQLPDGFRYQPGDYVFVRYPQVSAHEWHPFTVTTCPEETGKLSVHVRGLGNWTRKLHELAKARANGQRVPKAGVDFAMIDGPYGTPSTDIFNAENVVLIGAGIGVTPFAAILKSLFLRLEADDAAVKVNKAHFIWMNRDQYSFEWFSGMLADLEARDPERKWLDAHVYLTGVKLDMTSAALDVAMDVYQAETGKDLFTGLRNRTHLGRPDWRQIFDRIAAEHEGQKVDIFFCGPAPLASLLANEAAQRGFGFHKENF
jgi:predicted ferric reductase/Ca2+-binding EF-hand superfamily protein